jgi:hypothetical protein
MKGSLNVIGMLFSGSRMVLFGCLTPIRCTSTGRKCDGYVQAIDKPQKNEIETLPVLAKQQIGFFPGNLKHGYTINLFNQRTAPRIGGFYDHTFWSRIVVQIAHAEPAVRNAMHAVTRLYEDVELKDGHIVDMDSTALQSYTRAIQQVINDKASTDRRAYVSLIVCTLFICLEVCTAVPFSECSPFSLLLC